MLILTFNTESSVLMFTYVLDQYVIYVSIYICLSLNVWFFSFQLFNSFSSVHTCVLHVNAIMWVLQCTILWPPEVLN